MRAIVYDEYGTADVLKPAEVPKPQIGSDDQVLVRVRASSINSWDWDLVVGRLQSRLDGGFRRPKRRILGADVAGEVEAVGGGVTRFQPGDAVFGDLSGAGWGGFAEYVAVPESVLAMKFPTLSFEEAAAVPQAGVLALQGLIEKARLQPGDAVAINGAGGGTGTFAIQLAKMRDAEVTGIDHAGKLETITATGADRALDYQQVDFTREEERYDVILDVVSARSVRAYRRALRRGGRGVVVGGTTPAIAQAATLGTVLGLVGNKRIGLLLHRPRASDLERMSEYIDSGAVHPVVDGVYALEETAQAMRHFGTGQVKGKVVISV